LSQKTSLKV